MVTATRETAPATDRVGAASIVVRGLSVDRSGKRVLDEVDLDVRSGTVTGLLGPSGAGKTTIMRCLIGVQRFAAGTVELLGLPAGHPDLRHRVGYVTQAPSVYEDLTVRQNLRFFGAVLGAPRSDVDRVLAEVDLTDEADRTVGQLSGGQRARVSLATSLLGSPEILILDEPTVGLDPVLRRDLWALFHRLAAGGVTLLVSSHVMDEAERSDRLVLIRRGRLLADAPLAELQARTGARDAEHVFLRLVEGV